MQQAENSDLGQTKVSLNLRKGHACLPRNPLWLLVNTTIQAGVREVRLTNSAMVDILGVMRREECSPSNTAQPLTQATCR